MQYQQHISVLLQEVLELLTPQPAQVEEIRRRGQHPVLIDCTLGRAGHSLALLERCPDLHIIAFDQDQEAIDHAQQQLTTYPAHLNLAQRLRTIHENFAAAAGWEQCLQLLQGNPMVGVLADLGVSSHHFDSDHRGFSFRRDGPLDMRMDQRQPLTAASILQEWSGRELEELLTTFGEEPFAKKIAESIVERRQSEVLERTSQLEEICFLAYPKALRHRSRHPATLTFQALRMAVNDELGVLKGLLARLKSLAGGFPACRVAIISFHSLEDRIVKHTFKQWKEQHPQWQILTKRPLVPAESEVASNPRSRSAKLRVIEF